MNDFPQSTHRPAAHGPVIPLTDVFLADGPCAPSLLAEPLGEASFVSGGPEPPHSEDWLVFRESFLAYFEPVARATLRAAGDALYTRLISGDMPRESEPWTHARLRAVALDLRFLAQLLTELADEPDQSDFSDPEEVRLQRECPLWTQAAREIVLAIQEALGPAGDRP